MTRDGSSSMDGLDAQDVLPGFEHDWLELAWSRLEGRVQVVLERRVAGDTLDAIGRDLGVTRERIRQLQRAGIGSLIAAQESGAPDLRDRIRQGVAGQSGVLESSLVQISRLERSLARDLLFYEFGLVHPKIGSLVYSNLWTLDALVMASQVRRLYSILPCSRDDFLSSAEEVGMPGAIDLTDVGVLRELGVISLNLGFVRLKREVRDSAFLWLQNEGEPRQVADISSAVHATSHHALREMLRREEAFVQIRPEGTWALADWRLPQMAKGYENALDVVIEVLRDQGPLALTQLQTEVQIRYPVSTWRVQQCLSSNMIGLNADGYMDLVERGAKPIEDDEPKKPDHISESGSVIGLLLDVGRDLLRGSGLGVNRWLTWRLGLRTAPSSRHFRLSHDAGDVVVRRGLSNAQISSLRVPAIRLGVSVGCSVVLLLRTDSDSADLVHRCSEGECPAE